MIRLALAFLGLQQTESTYSSPAPVRFARLLAPGWGFVDRSVSSGDVLLGDHLYLRRTDAPDRMTLVTSLKDLRNRVRISSGNEALTLARMRTYAEFGSTFIPLSDWMEISHGPGGRNEGWFGGISDARWRRAKLPEPRVKKSSHGWVIRRAIVDFKGMAGEPFLVSETVSADGRYAVVSKRRLQRRALRNVYWQTAVVAE